MQRDAARRSRVAVVLTAACVAWCLVVHVWIVFTPLWRQGLVPIAVLVPTALALLATRAAWRGGTLGIGASALAMAVFAFITGFSIGNAYVPAALILVAATVFAAVSGLAHRRAQGRGQR